MMASLPDDHLKPEELEKITFTTIPYYELDTSFISSRVDYDHLDQYFRPSKPMYLVKLDGHYVLLVNLQKVGDVLWIPEFNLEGKEYFKKVFAWLIPELNVTRQKKILYLTSVRIEIYRVLFRGR